MIRETRLVAFGERHEHFWRNLCSQEEVKGILGPKRSRRDVVFVAEHQGVPVGVVVFTRYFRARFYSLIVAFEPTHRNKGLATQACQTALRRARSKGFKQVRASVERTNHASRRLIERLGFARHRRLPSERGVNDSTFFRLWLA